MAQIQTKNSTSTTTEPAAASLLQGELAVNIADGKLWVGDANGDPVSLLSGSVGDPIEAGSLDDILHWNSGAWRANANVQIDLAGNATFSGTLTGDGSGLTLVNASTLNGNNAAFYRDASNLNAGVLANARVQQSNVTQHQAALTLSASQTTSGTFASARISEASVTQHEAAIDAGSVDGYDIVVTGSPGSDPNTIYFVT